MAKLSSPRYTLSGSSPRTYALDFQSVVVAIGALRDVLQISDYPHMRDFAGEQDSYRDARRKYDEILTTLAEWEEDFSSLCLEAINHPRYR